MKIINKVGPTILPSIPSCHSIVKMYTEMKEIFNNNIVKLYKL